MKRTQGANRILGRTGTGTGAEVAGLERSMEEGLTLTAREAQ